MFTDKKMMLNKTRKSTLGEVHHNLEEIDCPPETSNSTKFSIYDLKTVKKDILTIFDAAQFGDAKAIMRYSKTKHFDVDAKVSQISFY
jgi:hypothetical protein